MVYNNIPILLIYCYLEVCSLLSTELLPKVNIIPKSRAEANKMISKLDLNYNSIQDFKNDCSLFRCKYEIYIVCHVCGTSCLRNTMLYNNRKMLQYFPLAPRVHLMFCGTWTLKINGVGISWMWLQMMLSRLWPIVPPLNIYR